MTKVKICGITRVEDALFAESLGADFIGFIFTRHSKRQIEVEQAIAIVKRLTSAKPIGVFIEQDYDETQEIARAAGLFGIQHYSYFAEGFASYFYIHAQNFYDAQPFDAFLNKPGPDVFLIDHAVKGLYGGTGQSFDWSALPKDRMHKMIIAGGIGPNNVMQALHFNPYAIDLSSSVEVAPGIKDHRLLERFFKEMNNANQL